MGFKDSLKMLEGPECENASDHWVIAIAVRDATFELK